MKMRKICFLPLCLLALKMQAQQAIPAKPFTLQGKLTDIKPDSVYFGYVNAQGAYTQQTVAVNNGAFSISGSVQEPALAILGFINKNEHLSKNEAQARQLPVYIESGVMTIKTGPDAHRVLEIAGSKSQSEWNALKKATEPQQKMVDSLSAGLGHNATAEEREKLTPYLEQLARVSYTFFLAHPDSYVTADRVRFYNYSLDSVKRIYNNFSPALKASIAAKKMASEIATRSAGQPGSVAALFDVKDRDDKQLSLAAYKGKYVLIDFWATWCVPCRHSMPYMISLHQKYKDKNFVMIGIADDDRNPTAWKAAIDKDGTGAWPQTLRGLNIEMFRRGETNPRDLSALYGVQALPTKILIDPQGKIIGRFTGSDDDGHDAAMDKMLSEIFK